MTTPKRFPKQATLIVFEGIDGSGKSTAAGLLIDRLSAYGVKTSLHPNCSLKPVREALDALAVAEGHVDRFEMFGANQAQFMGALLKWRELLPIESALRQQDQVVLLDRYIYTHFALAIAHQTTNGERLRRLFNVFPVPDVVLFMDVSPKVAAERVSKRGRDIDSIEYLTRLRNGYLSLPEMRQFVVVPGDQEMCIVQESVWRAVTPLVERLLVRTSLPWLDREKL